MNKEILSKKEKLFMYLVGTFQSSAWIALGKIKNPMTEKSKVNIEQASFYIYLLYMIQGKMKGNLTDYEEQMLINTVSELKLNLIDEKNISKDKKKPKKIKSLFLGFIGIILIPILLQIIFNQIIAYTFSILVFLASIFLLVNHFMKLKTLLVTLHTNNPKVFIKVPLNKVEIKEIKEIINNKKNIHPLSKSPVPLRNKLN